MESNKGALLKEAKLSSTLSVNGATHLDSTLNVSGVTTLVKEVIVDDSPPNIFITSLFFC